MRHSFITRAAAISIAILIVVAAACGDDNDDPAEPTPDLGDQPSSGVPAVDRVIAAVRDGDTASIQAQLRFATVACVADPPEGAGGPPLCRDDEADGTEVEVFAAAQCEGFWLRPDEVDVIGWPYVDAEFHAAYRTPAGFYPEGAYAVVLRRADGMAAGLGWLLAVADDDAEGGAGITGINFGCGESPEQLVTNQRLTDALIAPE